MKTLSAVFVLLIFTLYQGERVRAGLVTKPGAEDNDYNDKIQDHFERPWINATTGVDIGLYIIPDMSVHVLCGHVYGSRKLVRTRRYNASSSWFSNGNKVKVPLKISNYRSPKTECRNETYIRYSEILMKKVFRLTISNNFFGELKDFTFIRFYNVRHLDISYNGITSIASSAFYNLTRLETLDLSRNRLNNLNLDYYFLFVTALSGSHKLEFINMSFNPIHECKFETSFLLDHTFGFSILQNFNHLVLDLPKSNISTFDETCYEKIETYYQNVTILINGVPMSCNCTTNQSSTTPNVDLRNCTCPEKEKEILSSSRLLYEVLVRPLFIASFLSLLVIAFILYVFVRKTGTKRMVPDLCSKSFCTNVIRSKKKETDTVKTDKLPTYVYIVASLKDSTMIDMFVENLENKRNIPLIFKERDEIPGYFKLELFRKWIHLSTRTVFLINSNFLGDSDCTYIFNQAKAIELVEGRVIVVVVKVTGDLNQSEAMGMCDMLLSNSIFLNYTPSDDFWDKLVEIIKNDDIHVHISNTD